MKTLEAFCRVARRVGLVMLMAGLPLSPALAQGTPALKAVQVSSSAWYVEGLSALGSTANQNFISNAAFVVTPAGVVVIDALGSPAWPSACCWKSAS